MTARWQNWARTASGTPAGRVQPRTTAELATVLAGARSAGQRVKVVGAGHSFTPLAVTDGILVSLDSLQGLVGVDSARGRVRLWGGTRLHRIPDLLAPHALAMPNLGDIDRQSIAGALSTGTHGTGKDFGGLASQVTALTLLTADGELREFGADDPLLPGVVIGLGALGIVVQVELQCVPAFLLRAQEHPAAWTELLDVLDDTIAAHDHFEFYWWPHTDVVMTKSNTRLPADAPPDPVGAVRGWFEDEFLSNTVHRAACTLGHLAPATIPSVNRLATRLYGDRRYTDASHRVFAHPRTNRFAESEFAVPREQLRPALETLRGAIECSGMRISFPVEVRVAPADDVWLSTAYQRESAYIAVHRYWRDDADTLLRLADEVLRTFDGRPHWGKIHHLGAADLRERYPRFDDFLALRTELDPGRTFTNNHLERILGP